MKKNVAILLSLLLIIFLVVFLIISRQEVQKTQEIRTKAAGNGKVAVYFLSDKTSLNPGETALVSVWFRNTTTSENLQVNVGETDINFAQSIFTASFIGNNPCNQNFLYNAQKKTISPGDVYIVCSLGGGDPLVTLTPGQTIKLADFNLTVSATAGAGSTQLTFAKTNVPNAGDPINLTDLSDAGTITNLTILGTNPTATPTVPAQATNTPTPTPTSEPSLTPTPTEIASSPTPTPTNMPNTFNAMIDFVLKGVDVTSDLTVNSYRTNTPVSVRYLIYNKNDSSINVSGTANAVYTYNSNPTTPSFNYSLFINNVPNSLQSNAIVWLKPNKHLAARMCSVGQTLRCTSSVLSTGGIAFQNLSSDTAVSWYANLQSYPILPGDTNQDGVLNGQDVVEMLTELSKNPPDRNLQYDLNYDGVVNGVDYGLMLNSMVVYDDE